VKQIENFLYLESHRPEHNSGKVEFSEEEDEIFERWNKSEFADVFIEHMQRYHRVDKASEATLKVVSRHLLGLGNRHILKLNPKDSFYRIQPSLGDIAKDGKISKLLETTLHLEGKDLKLLTSSVKEMKKFSLRIDIALKVIRRYSPTSWERFVAFTDVIIPIKQKQLVSYSHQELPGVSMINLYDRDFVDLIDDLLHENGHHHLNHYLNLGKLIEEPIDCIYFSPWRNTLRPLRGIYHAYFTFFWAFKLFSDLASAKEVDSIWYLFSATEKEKILWRAIEEYWMLKYTFEDLKLARKRGLINDTGWELVTEQNKLMGRFSKKIPLWEKRIPHHRSELKALKTQLKQAASLYETRD
jgi:hypothetical protein